MLLRACAWQVSLSDPLVLSGARPSKPQQKTLTSSGGCQSKYCFISTESRAGEHVWEEEARAI